MSKDIRVLLTQAAAELDEAATTRTKQDLGDGFPPCQIYTEALTAIFNYIERDTVIQTYCTHCVPQHDDRYCAECAEVYIRQLRAEVERLITRYGEERARGLDFNAEIAKRDRLLAKCLTSLDGSYDSYLLDTQIKDLLKK